MMFRARIRVCVKVRAWAGSRYRARFRVWVRVKLRLGLVVG